MLSKDRSFQRAAFRFVNYVCKRYVPAGPPDLGECDIDSEHIIIGKRFRPSRNHNPQLCPDKL